jgi:hypothetical protein
MKPTRSHREHELTRAISSRAAMAPIAASRTAPSPISASTPVQPTGKKHPCTRGLTWHYQGLALRCCCRTLTSLTICRHRSTFFVPSFESSSTEQRVIIELPDTSVVARCCSAARNRRQGLLDCRWPGQYAVAWALGRPGLPISLIGQDRMVVPASSRLSMLVVVRHKSLQFSGGSVITLVYAGAATWEKSLCTAPTGHVAHGPRLYWRLKQ